MATYPEYDHTGKKNIFPLNNPIKQGYGVSDPDVNPAGNQANGMFVNQQNEKIEFWVEDIVANFSMTGSTAQSRNVRQFMPHNVVQPYVTVTGRAPNSFQYNRMASFVRSSHFNAFHPGILAAAGVLRHQNVNGQVSPVTTVRFVLRSNASNGLFPYNGAHVKGIHKAWVLDGYVKSMQAGGKRFDQAPQFQFDFYVASNPNADSTSIGLFNDTQVNGSALRPWLDWIKKDGGFVTINDSGSQDPPSSDNKDPRNNPKPSYDGPTANEVFPMPGWTDGTL